MMGVGPRSRTRWDADGVDVGELSGTLARAGEGMLFIARSSLSAATARHAALTRQYTTTVVYWQLKTAAVQGGPIKLPRSARDRCRRQVNHRVIDAESQNCLKLQAVHKELISPSSSLVHTES